MPLQPPYPIIRTALRQGRLIPFLGAGASFGARNPAKIRWRTPIDQDQDQWNMGYLPTAGELAECLAYDVEFPDEETRELTKVAQYYSAIVGNGPLRQKLNDIFAFQQQPSAIHHCLAASAGAAPLLIVTTNYDDLIERAFDAAGRAYDKVVHIVDPAAVPEPNTGKEIFWWKHGTAAPQGLLAKELDIDLSQVSVIYKIHGTIDRAAAERAQYVITEDDYIDFLARMTKNTAIPSIFAEPFQTRPFLFLGYALYDWNLRVVLNRIERELRRPGDIQSWAIEARPKPLERMLWERRNVRVFDNLSIDNFVARLQAAPGQPAKGNRR